MTLADGAYVRVSCNFELGDGTQFQNIYTYTVDGSSPLPDSTYVTAISGRVEAMYAELEGLVKDDVVEQLSFVDEVAWDGAKWAVVGNVGTFTITFAPTQTGDALPYQCAPFLIFKTTRPKSVGKKFLFPYDEAWQEDTHLLGGAITAEIAYGVLAIAAIPVGGVNDLLPGITRTGVEQWLTFQVAVVNDVIGSQKRRRPGVGA
ncbi:MAG: hypothetical protein KAT00_15375 [Planctomycetes bacterium]|nr:hypothetical protein [Planctomycetota bacterium]